MTNNKAKTLSLLKRHDIDVEKLRWIVRFNRENRPLDIAVDRKNPEFQKLSAFLEKCGGYYEGPKFKYWVFRNKKVIGRRAYTW